MQLFRFDMYDGVASPFSFNSMKARVNKSVHNKNERIKNQKSSQRRKILSNSELPF